MFKIRKLLRIFEQKKLLGDFSAKDFVNFFLRQMHLNQRLYARVVDDWVLGQIRFEPTILFSLQ